MSFRKMPYISAINNLIIDLPSPSNINYFWNFGSLLGFCLFMQIFSGLILSCHYSSDSNLAFNYISHIMRDVNYGWTFRYFHANGASLFFILLYLHTGRGIYFNSFHFWKTWTMGVTLILLTMMTGFLGYVLPWGQMSFWGVTVITNLISAIPYLGDYLTFWVWGGFSVNNATLTRFYTLHFITPFVILGAAILHIAFLHETGSSNPLGTPLNIDKIPFHPYFLFKDLFGFMITLMLITCLILTQPNLFSDPENFIEANPLSTPVHIQPEWYFLFAYAILRAVPSKLGGVLGLVLSILVLFSLPLTTPNQITTTKFNPLHKMMFWSWCSIFCYLTILGACPVEAPYIIQSQIMSALYFLFFLAKPLVK